VLIKQSLKVAVLLLLTFPTSRISADSPDSYPSLYDSFDPVLQRQLETVVEQLGLGRAARNSTLAITLVDITDATAPRVATINGDVMMYAASMPKIAILYAAFVEIARGRMRLDVPTRDALTRMIRFSSNEDATLMLNRVGKMRVAEILQSQPYRFYNPGLNGGLWVGHAKRHGAQHGCGDEKKLAHRSYSCLLRILLVDEEPASVRSPWPACCDKPKAVALKHFRACARRG